MKKSHIVFVSLFSFGSEEENPYFYLAEENINRLNIESFLYFFPSYTSADFEFKKEEIENIIKDIIDGVIAGDLEFNTYMILVEKEMLEFTQKIVLDLKIGELKDFEEDFNFEFIFDDSIQNHEKSIKFDLVITESQDSEDPHAKYAFFQN